MEHHSDPPIRLPPDPPDGEMQSMQTPEQPPLSPILFTEPSQETRKRPRDDQQSQPQADDILPVGSIRVNSLNELCLSPSLKDIVDFSMTRPNTGPRPVLNTKSKVFELDTCRTIGKVCLVYTGGAWSVWLATREGAWGWLADSFTHYFRMALVHLGLPGWQAAFANLPLIPWAEQLFLLLAPHLLDKTDSERASTAIVSESALNHIDPNIFKTSARQHKNTTRQANQ